MCKCIQLYYREFFTWLYSIVLCHHYNLVFMAGSRPILEAHMRDVHCGLVIPSCTKLYLLYTKQ